ncbi:hypothetical protein O3P69_016031 [Scylla paramamosain]|uniref:Uncharacterized protein n=1 Tax=Scylla paramamosain TaxID=85552 RepID=A0AAW0T8S0_SCYPA
MAEVCPFNIFSRVRGYRAETFMIFPNPLPYGSTSLPYGLVSSGQARRLATLYTLTFHISGSSLLHESVVSGYGTAETQHNTYSTSPPPPPTPPALTTLVLSPGVNPVGSWAVQRVPHQPHNGASLQQDIFEPVLRSRWFVWCRVGTGDVRGCAEQLPLPGAGAAWEGVAQLGGHHGLPTGRRRVWRLALGRMQGGRLWRRKNTPHTNNGHLTAAFEVRDEVGKVNMEMDQVIAQQQVLVQQIMFSSIASPTKEQPSQNQIHNL